MALFVCVWAIAMRLISKFNRKAIKLINIIFAVVSFMGITYITLMRSPEENRELMLMPLHSFVEAREQVEIYRSMLMNIALFLPLGATLPFALGKSKPIKTAILTAFILSVIIEALQFAFKLGRCETDDVLCNTLGAAIGGLSYFFSEKLTKWKTKKALKKK